MNPARAAKRPGLMRRTYSRLRAVFALIGVFVVVYCLLFDLSEIVSSSMSPTLQGNGRGDWVLSERITYLFRSPRRWELVKFDSNDHFSVMKRVVALPGERVKVDAGKLVINEQSESFPAGLEFLHYYAYGPFLRNGAAATVGSGYFVFGDDSKDSQDSRYEGTLSPERITARPWLIVWPLNRFGFVNP